MPRYIITVIESRAVEVGYSIEASDQAEAEAKAERGDTLYEVDSRHLGVTNREILTTTVAEPASTIKHPLPIGTKIRTIGGAAQGDWDEDDSGDGDPVERRTEPGEVGEVGEVITDPSPGDKGWSYSVVFSPSGVWVHLDEPEINNPAQYEVLS